MSLKYAVRIDNYGEPYNYAYKDRNKKTVMSLRKFFNIGGLKTKVDGVEMNDISGEEKRWERLIYIIQSSKSEQQYILKITTDEEYYRKEIDIYKELNEIAEKEEQLKGKIIKLYGSGEIEPHDVENKPWLNRGIDIIFKFTDGSELVKISHKKNEELYTNIHMLGRTETCIKKEEEYGEEYCAMFKYADKLLYIILEYDPDYMTLGKYTEEKGYTVSCEFVDSVVKDLILLNTKYGYCHWDLHAENLLVHEDKKKRLLYKFFDFDLATTNKNENYE